MKLEKFMVEKIEYESPEITVVYFDKRDVLTTSIGSENGFDGETDSWN